MEPLIESTLPRYQCHKVVSAAIIDEVVISTTRAGTTIRLYFEDRTIPSVAVTPEYMTKHRPQPGGWYVRYPDGYESFSPDAAFQSGYTRIEA